MPSSVASPSRVRLEASVSRPVTVISSVPQDLRGLSRGGALVGAGVAGSAEGTAVLAVQPRAV